MPIMDGAESTAKIMKELKDRKEDEMTNIVVLTSNTDHKTKQLCLKAGAKEVFTKPLSLKSL